MHVSASVVWGAAPRENLFLLHKSDRIAIVARRHQHSMTKERFGFAMAQIKIYGIKEHLNAVKGNLSDIIHSCVVDALSYPLDKRAHRFFALDRSDFYYPDGRTDKYTIIEISMFEGRSV